MTVADLHHGIVAGIGEPAAKLFVVVRLQASIKDLSVPARRCTAQRDFFVRVARWDACRTAPSSTRGAVRDGGKYVT